MCACSSGYQLASDQRSCIGKLVNALQLLTFSSDIDECNMHIHNCEHLCVNIIGSFNCSCQDGFILQSDGHTCEGNDQNLYVNCIYNVVAANRSCNENNSCEQLCALSLASSTEICSCKSGYVLDSNMKNCSGNHKIHSLLI